MARNPLEWPRRIITVRSFPIVKTHTVELRRWTGPEMKIAVLADLHVSAPWTSLKDIRRIVKSVNAARPDLIVLAGDYLVGSAIRGWDATAEQIVEALVDLQAPLGVKAIMGNHDWQDCHVAQNSSHERNSVLEAFEPTTIQMMQNVNLALEHSGQPFWLVGFDSQVPAPQAWTKGYHQPDAAFSGVPEDAATILLAHEPDYFAKGDERVDLQISGHTHGGQLNLFGWRPMTPSRFGQSFAYGHVRDGDRQMIVSGGIGFSGVPMRIGQAPEVTFIKIRGNGEN